MESMAAMMLGWFLFPGFFFYFLPTIIAALKSHHRVGAILLLNLFLGWTFIGWVIALVWSLTAARATLAVMVQPALPVLAYCSRCGAGLASGARFCGHCGARLAAAS